MGSLISTGSSRSWSLSHKLNSQNYLQRGESQHIQWWEWIWSSLFSCWASWSWLVSLLLIAIVGCWSSLSDFTGFIVSIISWQLISAYWALVMLVKPFFDAFLVKEVTTRQQSCLVLQVLATHGASGVLKWTIGLILFAVLFSNLNFWQVSDWLLGSWGCTLSSSILHRNSHNFLKQIVIDWGPEVELKWIQTKQ